MKKIFSRSAAEGFPLHTASLAPMVDLFTILVVAILRSGTPQPPLTIPEENFRLPLSTLQTEAQPTIVVDVGEDGIYVDGTRTGSASWWAQSEELLIRDLYEHLQRRTGSHLQIRSHAEVPWKLLRKVLLTSQQAGFSDIKLMAISSSSL